jgi:hypothetical protein
LEQLLAFDLRRAEKAPTTWFMDALAHLGSFHGGPAGVFSRDWIARQHCRKIASAKQPFTIM